MERVGQPGTRLVLDGESAKDNVTMSAGEQRSAPELLLEWLEHHPRVKQLDAVGHRIVHGMQHVDPQRVTSQLIDQLKQLIPVDPEHLPREIELLSAFHEHHPDVPQVVCFDTAFHHEIPHVARLLPIPRRYFAQGIRRYGFHGISYTYLLAKLDRLGDPAVRHGRVILAHLGSGASMAAVRNGACIDTSMGFTPSGGLVMGTRSGDLDPGLLSYLMRQEMFDAKALDNLTNHESGMRGISETSADIRDLLQHESEDERAADAVALFCYQAKKWIGAFAAALGGVDTLVFAGGIGENAAQVRARICRGLEFLGLDVDASRNAAGLGDESSVVISSANSRAVIRVIKTDEESVIAAQTAALLELL